MISSGVSLSRCALVSAAAYARRLPGVIPRTAAAVTRPAVSRKLRRFTAKCPGRRSVLLCMVWGPTFLLGSCGKRFADEAGEITSVAGGFRPHRNVAPPPKLRERHARVDLASLVA